MMRVGVGLAGLLLALVVLGPWLTPWDPLALDVGPHLSPPSRTWPFGTDEFGRDLWTRAVYGGRISLTVALAAAFLSGTVGVAVGAIAGFAGGLTERALVALTDFFLALPRLVLLLTLVAFARDAGVARTGLIVLVIGGTGWMGVARIVRTQVLSLRTREFVLAARSLGMTEPSILLRHVVPNTLAPVIVHVALAVGGALLTEAALSFLGLGVPPPNPTWGGMIGEGRDALRSHPWIAGFPALLIVLAVLAANLIGDALRDRLDPRA